MIPRTAFPKLATKLNGVLGKVVRALHDVSSWLLFAMLILGTGDVLGRYFLNKPITGARELSSIMVVAIVAFEWAHVQYRRRHITINFVVSRFPSKLKRRTELAVLLIGLFVFSIILWQSASTAMKLWKRGSQVPILEISLAPFHLLVTFGALVVCLEYIREVVVILNDRREAHGSC